jgi:hypothetical protein
MNRKLVICTSCNSPAFNRRLAKPGSGVVELLLWLLVLWPLALAYSLWRANAEWRCPYCRQRSVVYADTPRGREQLRKATA